MNYQSIIHPYPTKTQRQQQQKITPLTWIPSSCLYLSNTPAAPELSHWSGAPGPFDQHLCQSPFSVWFIWYLWFLSFRCQESRIRVKQDFRINWDFVPTSQIKVALGISKVFSHPCDIKTLLYLKCDLKILASLWLRPWTATNHLNTLSLNNVYHFIF